MTNSIPPTAPTEQRSPASTSPAPGAAPHTETVVPQGRPEPPRTVQRVPWSVLGPHFIHAWGYPTRGGKRAAMPQHLEVLGQNGSGKSFFVTTVLRQRAAARGSHIVFIATKPDDDTVTAMGWPIVTDWPPDYGQNQVVYWPKSRGISKQGRQQQREKILKLMDALWQPQSNIIVVFDEIAYVSNDLNLRLETEKYYREGRALGITIVAGTQRPQGVTRYMHSESSWTVCFAPKDDEDAERMAQVLGGKRTYMPILRMLDRTKYEFLIVENLTGNMYISWIDTPKKKRKRAAPNPR